jgi:hypothetical protein
MAGIELKQHGGVDLYQVTVSFFKEAYASVDSGSPSQPSIVECIAILRGNSSLYVYEPNRGRTYDISLSFKVKAIFPLRCGLLIQRDVTEVSVHGPVWFTLFNPFEEPVAVGASPSVISLADASDNCVPVVDRSDTLIDVYDNDNGGRILVSYHRPTSMLRVWYILESRAHEMTPKLTDGHNKVNLSEAEPVESPRLRSDSPRLRSLPQSASSEIINEHDMVDTPKTADVSGATRHTVRFRNEHERDIDGDAYLNRDDADHDLNEENEEDENEEDDFEDDHAFQERAFPFVSSYSGSGTLSSHHQVLPLQFDPLALDEQSQKLRFLSTLRGEAAARKAEVEKRSSVGRSGEGLLEGQLMGDTTKSKSSAGSMAKTQSPFSSTGNLSRRRWSNSTTFDAVRIQQTAFPTSHHFATGEVVMDSHTAEANGTSRTFVSGEDAGLTLRSGGASFDHIDADKNAAMNLNDSFNAPDTTMFLRRRIQKTGYASTSSVLIRTTSADTVGEGVSAKTVYKIEKKRASDALMPDPTSRVRRAKRLSNTLSSTGSNESEDDANALAEKFATTTLREAPVNSAPWFVSVVNTTCEDEAQTDPSDEVWIPENIRFSSGQHAYGSLGADLVIVLINEMSVPLLRSGRITHDPNQTTNIACLALYFEDNTERTLSINLCATIPTASGGLEPLFSILSSVADQRLMANGIITTSIEKNNNGPHFPLQKSIHRNLLSTLAMSMSCLSVNTMSKCDIAMSLFESLCSNGLPSLEQISSLPLNLRSALHVSASELFVTPQRWANPAVSFQQVLVAVGRTDLASMTSLAEALLSNSPRNAKMLTSSALQESEGKISSQVSNKESILSDGRSLMKNIVRTLLLPLPGGVGLGVLPAHGITGKPPSDAGAASAAAAAVINAAVGVGDMSNGAPISQDVDGLDALCDVFCALRFGRDKRMRTMARLLRSCRPHFLRTNRQAQDTDHGFMATQQQELFWHARRVCASSIGRGMLTLGSALPTYTDPVFIPVLTVAARTPPNDVLVRLDISNVTTVVAGITEWPEFHNGCAAALRLEAPFAQTDFFDDMKSRSSLGQRNISSRLMRSWVRSHRFTGVPPDLGAVASSGASAASGLGVISSARSGATPSGLASGVVPPNAAHGGMLMALGMTGALSDMSGGDIYEHLSHTHACTTIGLLLGLAAGRRGSSDPTVHKALILHIPALLPGDVALHQDLDIPSVVQSCSLIGLGLLHQGSGNRALSDILLAEIGRLPISERTEDREAYSLCAGLALGLVNLGRGPRQGTLGSTSFSLSNEGISTSHSKIDEKLMLYMLGGKDPDFSLRPKPETSAASGKPYVWLEGDKVNITVTSPSAAVALSLIYLRSGNLRVASALSPGSTKQSLESIRPDVLLLRCMARVLIMWGEHDADDSNRYFDYAAFLDDRKQNDIVPGILEARCLWEMERRTNLRRWITRQVPVYIRRIMRRVFVLSAASSAPGSAAMRLAQLMAMADDGGEDEPSSGNGNKADSNSPKGQSNPLVDESDGPLELLDLVQAKTSYIHIIAGTCLGLGLRYAGTGDPIVRDEILHHLMYVAAIREAAALMGGDRDGKKDNQDESARFISQTRARLKRSVASLTLSARALFDELTRPKCSFPNDKGAIQKACDRVNELLFLECERSPSVDDLLSPFPAPSECFPFSIIPDAREPSGFCLVPACDERCVNKDAIKLSKQRKGSSICVSSAVSSSLAPPSRFAIEYAMASLVSALGMVMAGTGDLVSLRTVRELRRRIDAVVAYGYMMASGMAIGLIGLGGGKVTLSRSNASIAALVSAFFPFWPHGTAGNAYFPQAPRNLHALAVDARCVDAVVMSSSSGRDVISDSADELRAQPVQAPLEVMIRGPPGCAPRRLHLITPCLLPEFHLILSIRILGPRFAPYTLDIVGNPLHASILLQGAGAILSPDVLNNDGAISMSEMNHRTLDSYRLSGSSPQSEEGSESSRTVSSPLNATKPSPLSTSTSYMFETTSSGGGGNIHRYDEQGSKRRKTDSEWIERKEDYTNSGYHMEEVNLDSSRTLKYLSSVSYNRTEQVETGMIDSEGMIRAQALSRRSLRPLFFVVMTGIKV